MKQRFRKSRSVRHCGLPCQGWKQAGDPCRNWVPDPGHPQLQFEAKVSSVKWCKCVNGNFSFHEFFMIVWQNAFVSYHSNVPQCGVFSAPISLDSAFLCPQNERWFPPEANSQPLTQNRREILSVVDKENMTLLVSAKFLANALGKLLFQPEPHQRCGCPQCRPEKLPRSLQTEERDSSSLDDTENISKLY